MIIEKARYLFQFLNLNLLKNFYLQFKITHPHSLINFQNLSIMFKSVKSNSFVFLSTKATLYFILGFTLKAVVQSKILFLNLKTTTKFHHVFLKQAILFLCSLFRLVFKDFKYLNSFPQLPHQFHFCFSLYLFIVRLFFLISLKLIAQNSIFNLILL